MQIRVLINTPKGEASKTEAKVRPFILGLKKPVSITINDDDSQLLWLIEGNTREIEKISQSVARFEVTMNLIVRNKQMKWILTKMGGAKKEDFDKLEDMLLNQTEIEVVKYATAKELAEDSKSIFAKIKDKIRI